ncbi:ArsR/SmtB family transcription factor [Lapillicoccus jejuensis]|uniref:ArsR family transcriptional regulator n=1 Tax=Lapillicoccus jejuensis TaxID=402171 RepID=A0A542E3R1_9MICO|nr:helix-turn-helix domain-containing protein [Lapillicoccus jejuensis]TQJ09957.1 ArsR family transcriptional regulator [Lapillicoccus jejuensis]
MSTGPVVTPTPQQLRALTHPARLRMLGMLRVDGPATATSLARALGLNTGATSYHLRQLAEHGFIEEDTERGNARDRWWRATASSTRTAPPSPDDVEGQDAAIAYLQSVVMVYAGQLQRSVEELPLLPQPWQDATTYSDWIVRLSPSGAAALRERLEAVVEAATDEEGEDTAPYVVNLNAYVRPGVLGEDR